MRRYGHGQTKFERIEELSSPKDDNGCRLWLGGHLDKDGYPRIWDFEENKIKGVHYIVLKKKLGRKLRQGCIPCHTCDNPTCVEPSHLWEGTVQQNCVDRENKGRGNHPKGSKVFASKLTEKQVKRIRKIKGETQQQLADKFGVSQYTIHCILYRKTWRHI